MTRAKPCTCPAFPYEHERYGEECVDEDETLDWPDDRRADDPRHGQAEWINSQR